MHHANPIPYSEEIRQEDTDRAPQTLTISFFPDEAAPLAIDLRGACPRCGHPIEAREWLLVVASAAKRSERAWKALAERLKSAGTDLSSGDETFDLTCSCDEKHPRRPADKHGCGSRFRVRVRWP